MTLSSSGIRLRSHRRRYSNATQLDSALFALSPGDSALRAPIVEGKALPVSMDCPPSRESGLLNQEVTILHGLTDTALDLSKSSIRAPSLLMGSHAVRPMTDDG